MAHVMSGLRSPPWPGGRWPGHGTSCWHGLGAAVGKDRLAVSRYWGPIVGVLRALLFGVYIGAKTIWRIFYGVLTGRGFQGGGASKTAWELGEASGSRED